MSEETRRKIEDFVKSAGEYQKLEVSNLPNVVIQVFPDKKFGKVGRIGILPKGAFKPIVLTEKRFEAIKQLFSNDEFVGKLEQLMQLLDGMYSKGGAKTKEMEKIEI